MTEISLVVALCEFVFIAWLMFEKSNRAKQINTLQESLNWTNSKLHKEIEEGRLKDGKFSEIESAYDSLGKMTKSLKDSVDELNDELSQSREIIESQKRSLKRYAEEIDKLQGNPERKPRPKFDFSEPNKPSKQQVAASKRLRDNRGRFAK